jgi:hypothetical protein
MTKTTTITWGSIADQEHIGIEQARDIKLIEMSKLGKTDGTALNISPECTRRYWADLASAEEYATFINEISLSFNIAPASIVIDDIV